MLKHQARLHLQELQELLNLQLLAQFWNVTLQKRSWMRGPASPWVATAQSRRSTASLASMRPPLSLAISLTCALSIWRMAPMDGWTSLCSSRHRWLGLGLTTIHRSNIERRRSTACQSQPTINCSTLAEIAMMTTTACHRSAKRDSVLASSKTKIVPDTRIAGLEAIAESLLIGLSAVCAQSRRGLMSNVHPTINAKITFIVGLHHRVTGSTFRANAFQCTASPRVLFSDGNRLAGMTMSR